MPRVQRENLNIYFVDSNGANMPRVNYADQSSCSGVQQ